MAATSTFYTDFFFYVEGRLATFTTDATVRIAESLKPAAATFLTIYIILYGWSLAAGKIQTPLPDSLIRLFKIALIFGLAFNLGAYNTYIANVATGLPNEISRAFVPAEFRAETTTLGLLDEAYNQGWEAGERIMNEGGVLSGNLLPYVVGTFVWLATLLVTLYAAFLLLLAKIAIAVILAVGPIFIVLALFEQTRRFLESWIAQLVNYVFVQILVAAVLGFTIAVFNDTAQRAVIEKLNYDTAGYLVIIGLMIALVLGQVTSMASGLSAGASLATNGAFGAASRALGGTGGKALGTAWRRSPPGRALEVRRAAREIGIRQEGASLARTRRERAQARQESGGTMARARSAATSGLQRLSRLRNNEPRKT